LDWYDHDDPKVVFVSGYYCSGVVEFECDNRMYHAGGVSRNQLPGKTRNDVKILALKQTPEFDYVPEDVGFFFPNIEAFDCVGCGIRFVYREDLVQFPKLKVLDLHRNRMLSIPGNLFELSKDLVNFDFSQNAIKRVGLHFFDHLTKLRSFYFSETECHPSQETFSLEEKKRRVQQSCIDITRSIHEFLKIDAGRVQSGPTDPNIQSFCRETFIMKDEV
jgi:hypothetical protein